MQPQNSGKPDIVEGVTRSEQSPKRLGSTYIPSSSNHSLKVRELSSPYKIDSGKSWRKMAHYLRKLRYLKTVKMTFLLRQCRFFSGFNRVSGVKHRQDQHHMRRKNLHKYQASADDQTENHLEGEASNVPQGGSIRLLCHKYIRSDLRSYNDFCVIRTLSFLGDLYYLYPRPTISLTPEESDLAHRSEDLEERVNYGSD
ncbi:hypothetical protein RND71_019260 [Anisodus tanguticus]|uniref:Uncharacterized protein n=1 Tax=Anisodus tanguticus TaxID=243964 RepID=A0AAE1V8B6_9SOLA|nr:hypothetical protein RND71_019260 [Anisodus tanguticus]